MIFRFFNDKTNSLFQYNTCFGSIGEMGSGKSYYAVFQYNTCFGSMNRNIGYV